MGLERLLKRGYPRLVRSLHYLMERWQNGIASVLKTVGAVTRMGVQIPLSPLSITGEDMDIFEEKRRAAREEFKVWRDAANMAYEHEQEIILNNRDVRIKRAEQRFEEELKKIEAEYDFVNSDTPKVYCLIHDSSYSDMGNYYAGKRTIVFKTSDYEEALRKASDLKGRWGYLSIEAHTEIGDDPKIMRATLPELPGRAIRHGIVTGYGITPEVSDIFVTIRKEEP